jgi:hypothetical protein
MPQTQEAVTEHNLRLQREVKAPQEQQRREAEQRRLASLRVPSNSSGGSSKPARAAVVSKKVSQTSVAGVDVEMASEVGSSGTAQTRHGVKSKVKSEMPDSDNLPEGAIEVRRNILNSQLIR